MKILKECLVLCLFAFVAEVFSQTPRVTPQILDSIPHNKNHFVQGLFFDGNEFIETTGLYGASALYRKNLKGEILDSMPLAKQYFGEGSIAVGDDVFYLTWQSNKAFIYKKKPFAYKGEFTIPTEGWGLAYWRNALLMSNGSAELLQISLGGFNVFGVIQITDNGKPVQLLNELEIVGDTLYANIWKSPLIAVISLPSGQVLQYIDLSQKIADLKNKYPEMDVLNGIAYDGKFLWVTGKLWPWIYKIKI